MRRSFVGRERELAALQGAIDRAVSGRGGLVRLLGEPGVGKTRLADELVELAYRRGLAVGWARTWRGSPPFGLIVDLLGSAARNRTARDLGTADSAPTRNAQIERFLEIVQGLGPSLLVIDDLHGADLDSLAFLMRLAPRLKQLPTLVLGTERSVARAASPEVERELTELARLSETVDLEGLDIRAVAALMAEVTGQNTDPRLAEAVHRATQGNALFVDGVLRAAVRDGSFDAGTLRFHRDVRQAILSRAEAAGGDALAVLLPAALLSRPFSAALIAELTGRDGDQVTAALERALDENLLARAEAGRFAFRHALVAEALAATLAPAERARIHASIAEAILVREGETAPWSEVAYHRCEAVPVGGYDLALDACARAANEAAVVCAHEQAARLLSMAKVLLETNAPRDLSGRLQVVLDLGRQLLLAGRRRDARVELLAGARVAELLGDVEALGAAALAAAETGEFGAVDTEKLQLLERALVAAGTGPSALRVRLAACLASELWVDRNSKARREELACTALDDARELGNDELLQVALDARFQSLWGPASLNDRIAIADELTKLAERSGDVEQALAAHRRRLLVAVETGDMAVFAQTLDAHAALASSLKRPALDETLAQRRFLLTVVRGDLEGAAALAEEIHERARQVQNPQAEMGNRFLRSELALHHGDKAALGALVAGFASDAERLPNLHFIRARTAQVAARAGDLSSARRHLELYLEAIAPGLNEDISTLAGLAFAADAAALIRASGACRTILRSLGPYSEMTASIGSTVCVGSVAHYRGLLERALSELDSAVSSLEAALCAHQRMGSPLFERETALELATTLELRSAPGDLPRAERLRRQHPEAATAGAVVRESPPPSEMLAGLVQIGSAWLLTWQGRTTTLGTAKGLQLIAHLVGLQGRSEHVLDLVGAGELRSASGQTDAPGLDDAAKQAYRRRLDELREEEGEAEDRGDARAGARARAEREAIEDELARSVGLGGRNRSSGTAERARVAVAKSIRRALDLIARVEPGCAAHLERSLRTGMECAYSPDPASRVNWRS